MRLEAIEYSDNATRSQFVVKRYKDLLGKKILDVGCWQRDLEKALPEGYEYMGIDFVGEPNIKVNLDENPRLPFDDGEYDTVVCTDVLEHLDEFYAVWDEIVRVARKHIIISLPNCWRSLRRAIEKGEGSALYYGLPVDRPEDRHRWFFNCSDLEDFFTTRAERQGLKILDQYAVSNMRHGLKELLRKIQSGSHERYVNRHAMSVWTIMEKE